MNALRLALTALVALAAAGCSLRSGLLAMYESQAWAQAEVADTPEAYSAFLDMWPSGKYASVARTRRGPLGSRRRGHSVHEFTSSPQGAAVFIESVDLESGSRTFDRAQTPFSLSISGDLVEGRKWAFAIALAHHAPAYASFPSNASLPMQFNWELDRSEDEGVEGEYRAFSLDRAREHLVTSGSGPMDREEVYNLGGIRRICGVVLDADGSELIIVGRAPSGRPPLTLDDLCVALRSRFVQKTWPVVSIDPPSNWAVDATSGGDLKAAAARCPQTVRFEGGLENTRFGLDLFEADYRLKLLGLGTLKSNVAGVPSYWDIWATTPGWPATAARSVRCNRFWFCPVLPMVSVREGVATIGEMRVEVFTEPLDSGAQDGQDEIARLWSEYINAFYEPLCRAHPCFSRLAGLEELVALSRAIEAMDTVPDLGYWLHDYPLTAVRTPTTIPMVVRDTNYSIENISPAMAGGVELAALAVRVKAGDVSALKDAVLRTRPSPTSLAWSFSVGEWVLPASAGSLNTYELGFLLTQARHLARLGRDAEAARLTQRIGELVDPASR